MLGGRAATRLGACGLPHAAFGMVGIALTQTAILNVVIQPVPEDGTPDDGLR